ncbi:BIR domain protein [Acanthamoeba polyphaga mimivirus]|nr:BIR domain protein [Acanthamoeba polyphaga mimivirus]
MEPININKMAIIRESIGESNNYSEMLDLLFKNLSNETLILTNLEETHNIMLYRGFNVWLLKCSFIAKKINFLSKITTVIILSSPLNSINDSDKLDFEMFQEYIKLVNPNISIKRIQLNIY